MLKNSTGLRCSCALDRLEGEIDLLYDNPYITTTVDAMTRSLYQLWWRITPRVVGGEVFSRIVRVNFVPPVKRTTSMPTW